MGLNQSVASLLTFHGGSGSVTRPAAGEGFRSRKLYASWSPTPYLECHSPLRLEGHDRALTLLSNSQAVLGVLESTVEGSRGMYSAGAYMHHYAKFGVEKRDFEDAFLGIEQAVQSYRSLG